MNGSVTGWLRWHAPELAAVTATTAAAVSWSPWCALLSAGLVGRWAWQEWRAHTPDPGPPPSDDSRRDRDERDEASA